MRRTTRRALPFAAFAAGFLVGLPLFAEAYIGRAASACQPDPGVQDLVPFDTGWKNNGAQSVDIRCAIDAGVSINTIYITGNDMSTVHNFDATTSWRSWTGYSGGFSFLAPMPSAASYSGMLTTSLSSHHINNLNYATNYSGFSVLRLRIPPGSILYGFEIF